MDQRIVSFLGDILALAGKEPDAVREGVRVAFADCEAIFRVGPHGWPPLSCRPSLTGRITD